MKVAAYQAPLLRSGSRQAIDLIRARVEWCESNGVALLCCPEAILGGLADYAADPREFAIDASSGQLLRAFAPFASDTVTTIVGFTEVTGTGRLHNTAAVFHQGSVIGLYRKLYPAINRSTYDAGDRMPVFRVGGLTFGIVICNDSNYPEPARVMTSKGAAALFIPTNNGLPPEKADVGTHARSVDIALATRNRIHVIRADVAGRANGMVSYGSSEIVDPHGNVLQSAQQLTEDLIVADLEVSTPQSMTIRLIGPGGAGKSTVGALLAERLGVRFVDLDRHFAARLGDIDEYIRRYGYNAYALENVDTYCSLSHGPMRSDVVALSSGFMTYASGIHSEYGRIRHELEQSAQTFVLLPSLDRELCVAETVRRQVARPFGRSAEREEAVIRARFEIYKALPMQKVETMRPTAAIVDEIVAALSPANKSS